MTERPRQRNIHIAQGVQLSLEEARAALTLAKAFRGSVHITKDNAGAVITSLAYPHLPTCGEVVLTRSCPALDKMQGKKNPGRYEIIQPTSNP